jgi:hypothetical protein
MAHTLLATRVNPTNETPSCLGQILLDLKDLLHGGANGWKLGMVLLVEAVQSTVVPDDYGRWLSRGRNSC